MEPAESNLFISYARKDGAGLAGQLMKSLEAKGFKVWLDTARLHGGAGWTAEIEQAIDRSRVVLALLTRGSYESDICRAEQLRSLRKQKVVIPLLAQGDADRPLHLEAKEYRDFSTSAKYKAQFRLLMEDIREGRNGVPLRQEFRSTRMTTLPPLPRNYIERPEALLRLRNAVITDDPGPSIALTALQGMGGIGKTILAQALSHDEVVQDAFPDGIIWTTVGQQPAYDLITRMQEVRRALGEHPNRNESELQCINCYRTMLQDKAALLIVDDVWRPQDLEPFRAESRRSRVLFTTRNASIVAAVGAEEHIAGLLTMEESHTLLARSAGWKRGKLLQSDDLIRECGYLPLAIAMIGAMLRGKPAAYSNHVLNVLRKADIARIEIQLPGYPHANLMRAIQVSVDALDGIARERYLAFAALLEDMVISPSIQQTLWKTDKPDALQTAEQFISLSLAQRDGDDIRVHDLQLDYIRAQFPNRDALELIHDAVRLSSNVIERDRMQFASQMVGRLLPYQDVPAIGEFASTIAQGAPVPWLRPFRSALHPPGTALIRTLTGHSIYVQAVAITPMAAAQCPVHHIGRLRYGTLGPGGSSIHSEGTPTKLTRSR
jgi:hypothetical protein